MRDAYDSAQRFHASNILKLRYLADPGDYRRYTIDEQNQDRQLNSICLMILEDNGYMNGHDHGRADGLKAVRLMKELGRDAHTEVVFFTIDHGPPYNWPQIAAYMDGTRDAGCGIPGFYGPNDVGDWLFEQHKISALWIAGAWSWGVGYSGPNTPPPSKHANGWQWPRYVKVGGVTCDYNQFYEDLSWVHGAERDWLDMATKEEVQAAFKAALMDAEVLQKQAEAFGSSNLYWLGGEGSAAHPERVGTNLGDIKSSIDANP